MKDEEEHHISLEILNNSDLNHEKHQHKDEENTETHESHKKQKKHKSKDSKVILNLTILFEI